MVDNPLEYKGAVWLHEFGHMGRYCACSMATAKDQFEAIAPEQKLSWGGG